MARTGRPAESEPRERIIFSLPESTAAKLKLYCHNPSTGRAYGDHRSQSALVTRLLNDFFAERKSDE
jgi:hypothetical protein